MNWKLIGVLTLTGAAMGIAVVAGLGGAREGVAWVLLGIASAVWIARAASRRYFLHGALAGFGSGFAAIMMGLVFFDAYLSTHPDMGDSTRKMPFDLTPHAMLLIISPLIGLVHAVLQGLAAWIAAKFLARREVSRA